MKSEEEFFLESLKKRPSENPLTTLFSNSRKILQNNKEVLWKTIKSNPRIEMKVKRKIKKQ